MNGLEALTLTLQGLLPLVLIGMVARPHPGRLSWALDVAVAGLCLTAIALSGLWLALPRGIVFGYAVLLVGAAALGTRSRASKPGRIPRAVARAGLWARAAVAVGLVATSAYALMGQRVPGVEPIDLAFPLHDGTYLAASGGSNELVNPHLRTLSGDRYRAYVGQSHAVDLVKVGRWGSRDAQLSPDDPEGFAIFDDPLTSPCSGTVVAAVDGHPDVLQPGATPATLPGNHVILACEGAWIVLAHLRRGTVCVSEGDVVDTGDRLGRVGNSGSSDEPHLHIHAQSPGTDTAPLGGAPIPITFDGRYLARNDRVRVVPQLIDGHAAHD
jgi:hypothetical protein